MKQSTLFYQYFINFHIQRTPLIHIRQLRSHIPDLSVKDEETHMNKTSIKLESDRRYSA